MESTTVSGQARPLWSLKLRLGLLLTAALVAYPLSIGPTLFVLYQTRLVAYPLTGRLFNAFYAPLHWVEALSPLLASFVDWYIRLFLEVHEG